MNHDMLRRWGAFFILALPCAFALAEAAPPVAPVRDQVDTFHGVAVPLALPHCRQPASARL